MCRCKLGTTPVNRLTQEQCDILLGLLRLRLYGCNLSRKSKLFNTYERMYYRIQQYKDNLKNRGL